MGNDKGKNRARRERHDSRDHTAYTHTISDDMAQATEIERWEAREARHRLWLDGSYLLIGWLAAALVLVGVWAG